MTNFEEIYNTYATRIFRVCMGYTNDVDQAKDLVQETFISVWAGLESFRNESHISTWIFRIATNKCIRALEIAKRMPSAELPFNLTAQTEEFIEEKVQILFQCISELEEVERLIISMELEGLPQAEIAAIVGLSTGNIRVRIYRIKDKLRKKLINYEQFR